MMVIFGVNGGLDGVSWCISWLQIPGTCPDPPNPALSMPTAPPTSVLLLAARAVRRIPDAPPTQNPPSLLSSFVVLVVLVATNVPVVVGMRMRDGRDGRPGAGYGGGLVGRSGQ